VPILVAARLLKLLGNPPPHGVKSFRHRGSAGTGPRSGVAGQSHQRAEPALPEEKLGQAAA